MHGQGASAHSHFYLAADYKPDMEHHEEAHHEGEEEHETVERHTMEVGFRTEFIDVAKWLPDIAAASDMSSKDWQSVSDASKKITGVVESIPAELSDTKYRDAWKEKSAEIGASLKQLEETLAATAGDGK